MRKDYINRCDNFIKNCRAIEINSDIELEN